MRKAQKRYDDKLIREKTVGRPSKKRLIEKVERHIMKPTYKLETRRFDEHRL